MKSIKAAEFKDLLETTSVIFDTRSEALYKHNGLPNTKHLSLRISKRVTILIYQKKHLFILSANSGASVD